MTCPTPWILSMHADGALPADEARALERHAGACASCTAVLDRLAAERSALRAALRTVDEPTAIPAFARPARRREWLALVLGVAATGAVIEAAWSGVPTALPSALRWLNPFGAAELTEQTFRAIAFILHEGPTMWTTALNAAAIVSLLALVAAGAAAFGGRRPGAALLASLLVAACVLPKSSDALEVRRGDLVTLAAGETVDDTLLATGETIAIDGDVTGDLLAFGRSVTVRGNVGGDVVAGAETVTIEGTVGGNVIGGARALSLIGTGVGRNVYGGGRDVDVGRDTSIGGNAIAFGDSVTVDGRVSRDLKGFGSTVTIGGTIDGDAEGFAENVILLSSARIGGDLTAHVESAGNLRIASGAVVDGATEETVSREEPEHDDNRYLTIGYYVGEVVALAMAFVAGLLLLAAFPALRTLSLPDVAAVARSGGIGLAAAIALPIAAIAACITVIGIPIGIAIFVLGALGLYLAKAVVAQIIGTALFRGPRGLPHFAVTLLAGLLLVRVAINVPFVGGIANFALTLVGFGLLVSVLYARLQRGPLD